MTRRADRLGRVDRIAGMRGAVSPWVALAVSAVLVAAVSAVLVAAVAGAVSFGPRHPGDTVEASLSGDDAAAADGSDSAAADAALADVVGDGVTGNLGPSSGGAAGGSDDASDALGTPGAGGDEGGLDVGELDNELPQIPDPGIDFRDPDREGPQIPAYSAPPEIWEEGSGPPCTISERQATIAAIVIDPSGIESVRLDWKVNNTFGTEQMALSGADNYVAVVGPFPAGTVQEPNQQLGFQITARDRAGNQSVQLSSLIVHSAANCFN